MLIKGFLLLNCVFYVSITRFFVTASSSPITRFFITASNSPITRFFFPASNSPLSSQLNSTLRTVFIPLHFNLFHCITFHSTSLHTTPLHVTPITNPLNSFHLTPLHSSPLHSTPLEPLRTIPRRFIPDNYIPLTPPLHLITIQSSPLLSNPQLSTSFSPLHSIPLLSTVLHSSPHQSTHFLLLLSTPFLSTALHYTLIHPTLSHSSAAVADGGQWMGCISSMFTPSDRLCGTLQRTFCHLDFIRGTKTACYTHARGRISTEGRTSFLTMRRASTAGTIMILTWVFMANHVEEMTDKRTSWRPRKVTSVEMISCPCQPKQQMY